MIDEKTFKARLAALESTQGIVWSSEPIQKGIPINVVTAYRCPGCRRVYINRLSALRHADKCVRNPHNKTCLTCANRITLSGGSVQNHDKCHCTNLHGQDLIDSVRWVYIGRGEDAECQYSGHDIVWDCPYHNCGRGWTINRNNYEDALELIIKAQEEK